MLFLIPLAEPVIGRVCPLVTLQLIPQLRNTLYQSPRNKLKQEFPLAKLCHFSLTSLISCAPAYVTECSFHPYPHWKGTSYATISHPSVLISTRATEHLNLVVFIPKRSSCYLRIKVFCFSTRLERRFIERTQRISLPLRRLPKTLWFAML